MGFKRKIWILIITSFLLPTFFVCAQNINVAGVFPTIDHSGAISSKLDYSLYYFAAFPLLRFNKADVANDSYLQLLYSEQALSYHVNRKVSLTASYVYQREHVGDNSFVNENRFYVQAKYKHRLKALNFSHRLRFDGRFVQNLLTKESPFTHRLRYLIGMDVPINERLYFAAYEEVFFNTFAKATAIYGENWAYAALGKKLNGKNKIEAGILYLTWNIGAQSWFNQYYFQLTWISHLDFRK